MIIKQVETEQEQQQAFQIRKDVFIDEQNVPADEEIDEYDATAIHFIGIEDAQPVATSRLRFTDDAGKLERICVLRTARGQSIGTKLITQMEKVIAEHNHHKAKLNAQTHAIQFYSQLGYDVVSEEFLDAGIPHVTMIKQLNN